MDIGRGNTDLIGSIELRLDQGASLEEIDREIRGLGLPMDEQDALSLYAWAWRETGPAKALEGIASLVTT